MNYGDTLLEEKRKLQLININYLLEKQFFQILSLKYFACHFAFFVTYSNFYYYCVTSCDLFLIDIIHVNIYIM